ncbi:MAG: helix-hairpin-helix domain-containing protein [Chlamydiae bacterium]|nr:helix-hairpin-helix domain-containing protein [Chlamydiota bacterium]MBI3277084.1 helix-hairpin-helix domain-containing protein [Chlamydiota bacterium]
MKSLLKKSFVLALLVLNVLGLVQLSSEIFIAHRDSTAQVEWIKKTLEKISFAPFDPKVFKMDSKLKILAGRAKKEITEFLKVDVNHASLEDLIGLPRVGPATAKRIIEVREAMGAFLNLEDLKKVKGLGQKSLEKLKDWVRFDSVPVPEVESGDKNDGK